MVLLLDGINLRKVSGYIVWETALKHQASTTLIHSWNRVFRFKRFAFSVKQKQRPCDQEIYSFIWSQHGTDD